jgi:hypothetical protein
VKKCDCNQLTSASKVGDFVGTNLTIQETGNEGSAGRATLQAAGSPATDPNARLMSALDRLKPDFDTHWSTTNERAISEDQPTDHGTRGPYFVIRGDGRWYWGRADFDGAFVCQARGSTVANPTDRWGLRFCTRPFSNVHVSIWLDDEGDVWVDQNGPPQQGDKSLATYHFKPLPNQDQTLTVQFDRNHLQVAVNGLILGDPLTFDSSIVQGSIDTTESSGGPNHPGEVQFDWVKLWTAATLQDSLPPLYGAQSR